MLVNRFETIVSQYPGNTAVDQGSETVTYEELNAMANRLGAALTEHLHGSGGEEETVTVGLLLPHGLEQAAGLLAVLKAGKTYVPLDPNYPKDRLLQITANAGISLIVTSQSYAGLARTLCQETPGRDIRLLDIREMENTRYPGSNITQDSPGDLAYILYTSGTTGIPKGVAQRCESALFYAERYIAALSITPGDKVSYVSSFGHDGAVNDIYAALMSGAALCPYDIRGEAGINGLGPWMAEKEITVYHSVVSVYRYMTTVLEPSLSFPRLRLIVTGGEPLQVNDILAARKRFPGLQFAHMYGMTESSVNTMGFIDTSKMAERVTIGQPLDGITLLVLNEEGEDVDPFETGEIFVACPHIAPGYWKNPEAAQKAFFEDEELGRLYRTGDLGRLGIDGSIEFAGRKDRQVKIRGFRIELPEIEDRLRRHDHIEDAVVTVQENTSGEHFLYAYLVPQTGDTGDAPPAPALSAYLEHLLPDYMVPQHYHFIDKMPLSSTGKVDRRALPEPQFGAGEEYTAPRDDLEKALEDTWAGLLQIDHSAIGIDADFFTLGGHSLRATILVARIQKNLGTGIPLQKVFELRTIRHMAHFIRETGQTGFQAIDAVEDKEYYPLTTAQLRFYFMQQMDPQGTAFNMPQPIPVGEDVDAAKLQETFNRLIQRHEALRTRFTVVHSQPVQVVLDRFDFQIEQVDGNGKTIRELMADFIRPFDLTAAPLIRASLVSVEGKPAYLLTDMHHIISDGTSQLILQQDFIALFTGAPLPGLKLRYRDFAQWFNRRLDSEEMKAHEDFWLDRLKGVLPGLNLPTDFPRPARRSIEGAHYHVSLGPQIAARVNKLAQDSGATLYMVLLAAFNVLLSRYSGQHDILVGSPVAGRTHADLENVIGLVIGGMVLRNNPHPMKRFDRFLEELKEDTLEAYEHQAYPLEELLKKINWIERPGHDHIIDATLVVQNMFDDPEGRSASPNARRDEFVPPVKGTHSPATSKLDITMYVVEAGGDIWIRFEYCTALFKPQTIERMIEHYAAILHSVSQQPAVQISHIDMTGDSRKKEVIGSAPQCYHLTHAQKRIYYTEKTFQDTSCNTAVLTFRYKEILDHALLEHAVNIVLERNEGMRLRVAEFEFQGPVQYVVPHTPYTLDIHPAEWIDHDKIIPIPMEADPLYKFAYIRYNENETGVYIKIHHIITDGWSVNLLINEITAVYDALKAGQPAGIEANPSYLDYLSYENDYMQSPRLGIDRIYWREKLLPLPEKTELWRNKTDSMVRNPEAKAVVLQFPGDVREKMHRFRDLHRVSLYKQVVSALSIYISRVTGSPDVVIAGTNHNRTTGDHRKMTGMFVTTFPIRIHTGGEDDFQEFAKTNSGDINHLLKNHQRFPFDLFLEELRDREGADAVYLLDINVLGHPDVKEARFSIKREFVGVDPSPLTIHVNRNNRDMHGVFELMWQYQVDLFDFNHIEQIHHSLINILDDAFSHPQKRLRDIQLISEHDRESILYDFNDTDIAGRYPEDVSAIELIRQSIEQHPGRIALSAPFAGKDQDVQVSYRVLGQQIDRLAERLQAKGTGPGTIVGLYVEPSLEMITGILAILRAGGAYLPINPENPPQRTAYILSDSCPALVLVQDGLTVDTPAGFQGEIMAFHIPGPVSHTPPQIQTVPEACDAAYIIYTSGSTGKPKGVVVEHRNLTAYLNAFDYEFELTPSDITIQQASYAFDAFVEELYPVLLKGGKLAVPGRHTVMDIDRLAFYIRQQHITFITCSPLLLNELNQRNAGAGIRIFISGGDRLKTGHIGRLAENGPEDTVVYNTYGPTESTVCATYYCCQPGDPQNVPIGKPIANYRVYILDRYHQPLPFGVPGELCISGPGIARGYLNNPALTADKFILAHSSKLIAHREEDAKLNGISESSFATSFQLPATSCLYKTGDLVMWNEDGNIEFLGRIDRQVKVRGFRIELGEIESRLNAHHDVKECVVIDRTGKDGDVYLCAYIVPVAPYVEGEDILDVSSLREHLSETLPEYMVPARFTAIEKIPVSAGNKVDVRALPEPGVAGGRVYEAPRDALEEKLEELWQRVLAVEKEAVGIDGNFFDLGGHSLKATSMLALVHRELDVQVPLAELFKQPTIRGLARFIRGAEHVGFDAILPAEQMAYYPLSFAQKRMYVLRQIEAEGTGYNMPRVINLGEHVDAEKIEQAFRLLIQRHESLRTSFHSIDGTPVQQVHEPGEINFSIEYNQVSAAVRADETKPEMAGQLMRSFIRPFDLSHAPLLRAGLVQTGDHHFLLMVDMHHIISDGMSVQILIKDFLTLYSGDVLPPLDIQYKDFAVWQQTPERLEAAARKEQYWLERFSGDLPVLDLPLDFPRPPVHVFDGQQVSVLLPVDETRKLNARAAESECTLFMVLTAALHILLHRLSGSDDIVTGTAVAGRGHADLENVIGMFINTLAIRHYPQPHLTISQFLQNVKESTLDAFENQDYPFEELVETVGVKRDTSRNPLFDVMFILQNMVERRQSSDVYLNPVARFDLTFMAFESDEGLGLYLQYGTALFKENTANRFLRFYQRIISHIIDLPGDSIAQIQLIDETERQNILFEFNNTHTEYHRERTACDLFGRTVEKYPDAVALVEKGNHAVTFKELDRRSDVLAVQLEEKGVTSETIVALMVERSASMITGMMGILKTGGAFLPLDPSLPQERLRYILADSNTPYFVSNVDCSHISNTRDFIEIKIPGEEHRGEDRFETCPYDSLGLVYVIYTSGTTGRPKGTLLQHQSLINLCTWTQRYFQLTPQDRCTQYAAITFDASIAEIFPPLLNGTQLHIIDDALRMDITRLKDYYNSRGITFSFLPTQMAGQFMEDTKDTPYLKTLLTAGEKLNRFTKRNYQLYNNYGPTENTVAGTVYPVTQNLPNIPIGTPNHNVRAYVLDPRTHQPQPIGIPGELCLAGDGLARGYLNQPELTGEKFILAHSSWLIARREKKETITTGSKEPSFPMSYELPATSCLYRTGDLVRWMADGNIEFLGRIDEQVKVRGFRIELGEVTRQLLEIEGVTDAVVVALEDSNKEKYLCGYYVSDAEIELKELKEKLQRFLPDYMVPAYLVYMEKFPVTSSGKVDTRALPVPGIPGEEEYIAPSNELERSLVGLWADVLGLDAGDIGINMDFFDLGGHSLKATSLSSLIHKELSVKVPLPVIFSNPTIEGLVPYIKEQNRVEFVTIEPVEQKEYYPISSAQKRLYVLQQMEPHNTSYNMPQTIPLGSEYNEDKLLAVFRQLIRRHEMLRTSFTVVNELPVQLVHPDAQLNIEFFSQEAVEQAGGFNNIKEKFRCPFDLASAPLIRAGAARLGEAGYVLMLDMHHIITDGTSQEILTREFAALLADPGAQLPGLRLQYKDYSHWHAAQGQEEIIKKQEEYWKREFYDPIPTLGLPTDFPRPGVQGSEGNLVWFNLDKEETRILKETAEANDVTLYMVLTGVFNILLSKLGGQEDIVLGTPVAARRHSDLHGIVGMMVNTLAMRMYPSGQKTFGSFLEEIKERTLQAYENQEYPFEDLVDAIDIDRDTSRNPVFDIMLNLLNQSEYGDDLPRNFENMPLISEHVARSSRFDMSFSAVDYNSVIRFTLEYSTQLWTPQTIETFIGYLRTVIRQIPGSRDRKLSDFRILSHEEEQAVLKLSTGIDELLQEPHTVHERFTRKAAEAPDHTALVFDGHHITYRCLNRKSNQLARLLREKNVGKGSVVGLLHERSFQMVIGMLAILKAGGAYLPIDPEYPEQRIRTMLTDSRVDFLLTHSRLLDRFSVTDFKKTRFETGKRELILTPPRPQIRDFDSIPIPDRTLIDYDRYHRFIGEAPAKNTITMQATRGCPYNCLYCHKIWPKTHVARSAGHIFTEISRSYDAGLKRFVFIDDIFNLDKKNSTGLLEKIVKSDMDIQLFFPNGFRADILTPDFIDLMMEAGTVNLDVALESASPRLQKLIRKNLNLDKFKENVQYITQKYPHVILEMEMMHGFPTETPEEAEMTLQFLKEFKWVHFPNLHVLKIFPNTDICKLAVENGISMELIEQCADLAFHELPDTLPFPKSFTRRFQARFMGEYFLNKERILHVLPHQMKVLTEDELIQKYDSYLSSDINTFDDILHYTGISREELSDVSLKKEDHFHAPDFREKIAAHFPAPPPRENPLRVLLLDMSQLFSEAGEHMLHHQVEEPLGLMYLMSYLNDRFKGQVAGKVLKSRIDFDSYRQLETIIREFNPGVIGIRTLSFYKEFFHKTVAMIRQWGIDVPIISGGPYATSDYQLILQDPDVDLVVMGEGEHTLGDVVQAMLENQNRLPGENVLKEIRGLAFASGSKAPKREIILPDQLGNVLDTYDGDDLPSPSTGDDLLYVIYTSGSTGKPKGVMLQHRNLVNLLQYQQNHTNIHLGRVLQFTTISFDVSAQEIFSTLLSGGTLALVTKETVNDVPQLLHLVEKEKLSTMFLPASFLKFVMNEEEYAALVPAGLKHIVTAGEQLIVNERLRKHLKQNNIYLHNHYGPSETHVVTALTLDPNEHIPELPTIGKPVSNTAIYILDKALNPVPQGVPGELVIGGIQVGKGYLHNEALTVEKFFTTDLHGPPAQIYTDGFVSKDGHEAVSFINHQSSIINFYRSGDLARYLSDGNIEFLGRIDHQVKIRGFRIEPGEIENRLMDIFQVKEAVVLARDDSGGGKYLCAYVVPAAGYDIDTALLRESLAAKLPDYMVPSYIVPLERIPLTPNRKVDRKALPQPDVQAGEDYVAPGTDKQMKLVLIWADTLGIAKERIGIDDNFFELGGHSLKATILTTRIHKAFNVRVPLLEVFKTPTVRQLADYIETEAPQEDFIPIEPVEKRDFYPMSSAQKRLFILMQMETGLTAYNMLSVSVIPAAIDKDRLEQALYELIQRHETLRTSFHMEDENAVQTVHDQVEFALEFTDLSGSESGDPDTRRETGRIVNSFVRPFDLSRPPLMRVGIIKIEKNQTIFLHDLHHIITDGMSQSTFVYDLLSLYTGRPLPELRIQYKDYALWQQGSVHREHLSKQEEFWTREFSGDIPVLTLPTDYTRPPIQGFEGRKQGTVLGESLTHGLKELTGSHDATLFMTMLSFYSILLSKLCQQEDIVIGTPVAGREHADLEAIIGMFVNTLAMRNRPEGEKTFSRYLTEVRERSLMAFANQDYLFEDLVALVDIPRDVGRNPLFDVMFNIPNMMEPSRKKTAPSPDDGDDIQAAAYPGYESKVSKFDMSLLCIDRVDQIDLSLEYSTQLFKDSTVQRFLGYLKNLIASVVESPELPLKDIVIMSPEEQETLLYRFNDTAADYPAGQNLYQLFNRRVRQTPDKTALVFHDQSLTYRDLDTKAGYLAARLMEKGAGSPGIVALMPERSIEMIIGIMGILKAGCAYLPLDPEYPRERIRFMLDDSNTGFLVVSRNVLLEGEMPDGWQGERIVIDEVLETADTKPVPGSFPVVDFQYPAYVIYTSGSTGKPKGVLIGHYSVANLVFGQAEAFGLDSSEHVMQFSSICFDASVDQIFMTLLIGASLFPIDKDTLLDIEQFESYVTRHAITYLHAVPSFLETLTLAENNSLKRVNSGGEACPVALARHWSQRCDFINSYGPTETTVTSIEYKVEHVDENTSTIPLGTPLTNTTIFLLDANKKNVPIGVAGELYIGGHGLALGYLNRPELTAERFIIAPPHVLAAHGKKSIETWGKEDTYSPIDERLYTKNSPPFSFYDSYELRTTSFLYKSGDLVRWLDSGVLEFLGRIDQQVKIRGFRIELGEIEHLLRTNSAVKEAVVTVHDGSGDDRHLCAYVTPADNHTVDSLPDERLDNYLTNLAPSYMVPTWIIPLDQLPLTPSGKLDRKALPAPQLALKGKKVLPTAETGKKLALLWASVLNLPADEIGVDDGFFQLGGHSLKATLLAGRIHKEFKVKLTLTEIFQNVTIRTMAECIKDKEKEIYFSIEPAMLKDFYPVSSAQKRMYVLQALEPGRTDYNTPILHVWEGDLDIDRLKYAFDRLIQRHEVLRTSIEMKNGELVQVIHDQVQLDFQLVEMDPAEGQTLLDTPGGIPSLIPDFIRPFDLSVPPLLRSRVVKIVENVYLYMVDMHHIVSDGVSNQITIRDFMTYYAGEEMPPLKLQYKDYAQWQNNLLKDGGLRRQEEYWLNHFAGELPVLNLPLDNPRPTFPDYTAGGIVFRISTGLTQAVKDLITETEITPYIFVLSVYNILLSRYCGQQDIIVGTASAGRRHDDLQDIVGLFVNMLAMRNKPLEDLTFMEFLMQVKTNALNAYENQDYQFDQLVEKLGIEPQVGRNALFDVQVTFQNAADTAKEKVGQTKEKGNSRVSYIESPTSEQSFDLGVNIYEEPKNYRFLFGYLTALFNRSTIEKMTEHYREILEQCLENRDIVLKDIVISLDLQEGESSLSDEDVMGFDF